MPLRTLTPPSPRSDQDDLIVTTRYSVRAPAEPGIMPRVLELFAKRGLVPRHWRSTATELALTIEVEMTNLDRELAEHIGRTMQQIVGIEAVLSHKLRRRKKARFTPRRDVSR